MSAAEEMARLEAEVRSCELCPLANTRKNAVPGEGPVTAKLMLIGEGPGYHENEQGRPFVGAAGKFLEELLASAGFKREDVYITNVVKCFISPRVLIYTAEGYKPIKDIRIGDLVLTHTGRFRRVTYVRPREILPAGADVVRLTVQADVGNKRPVSMTVTPEHPFLINGEWKRATDLRVGDRARALADQCEVCGKKYFVRYDRYEQRTYRTCSYRCHNRRIYHNPEARARVSQSMRAQNANGKRDPSAITARAHEKTRQLVAAGQAKVQHFSSAERHRGRVALAARVSAGKRGHREGYGERELCTILDGMEIEYVHLFAFPGSPLIYDFCLPEHNTLIEVRGPGFNNRAAQERATIKHRLAKSNGYLVLNLWWAQIVEQPEMIEKILRRLLRNHTGDFHYVDIRVTRVERNKTKRNFPLYNIGVEEDESYIAAGIVSHNCRPPGNRDPEPGEIEACRSYLDRQIALIDPRVIVTLGRFSMARWFPGARISAVHGQPKRLGSRMVVPMFHPAAALHQPKYRPLLIEDFKQLPAFIAELEAAGQSAGEAGAPDEPPPEQLSLF